MSRGLPGHPVLVWLDLTGAVTAPLLTERLANALAALPVLRSAITHAGWTGAPAWEANGISQDDPHWLQTTLRVHDLRHSADAEDHERGCLLERLRAAQHPAKPPQIRLDLFQLPDDHQRLAIRCPHYLMDLDGVQLLLQAIAQADHVERLAPHNALAEMRPKEGRAWFGRRAWDCLCGIVRMRCHSVLRAPRFRPQDELTPETPDFAVRRFDAADTAAIFNAAREACAPGPALHTRHFMLSVAEALDDLREELGMHDRGQYILPLPMRRYPLTERTVVGRNDLTIATCVIDRGRLQTLDRGDAVLRAQIERLASAPQRAELWTTMSGIGQLPWPWFTALLQRRWAVPRYSVGFSNYAWTELGPEFCGGRIIDLAACTLPPIPPGVMLNFCRFAERLTLGVAYYRHLITPGLLAQFLDRVEVRLRRA